MKLLILLIIALIVLSLISVRFRCFIRNPFQSIFYVLKDLFFYLLHKDWRVAPAGKLVVYCGLFGKGKTLSCVHTIVSLYNNYNNLKVWDRKRNKFVTQKIVILSNVTLSIPYLELKSLPQVVELAHNLRAIDEENDTLTYLYVLGDEFSVQMNSRNFKTNIDALFLNTLLCCRHYNLSFYLTSQRFNHMDALLRQVSQTVYQCNKIWRFQILSKYDAYELENCTNPLLVKPLAISAWFVCDKDFNNYDTLAVVNNLSKAALEGDMISAEEILNLQQADPAADRVTKHSKIYIKRNKKAK